NRTGTVEVDDEMAFMVRAEDSRGRPKTDLGPAQRWRGIMSVLNTYRDGRWTSVTGEQHASDFAVTPVGRPGTKPAALLPNLGDRQFFLAFSVSLGDSGGFFVGEPLVLKEKEPVPVVSVAADGSAQFWQRAASGEVQPAPPNTMGRLNYYQVT